MHFVQAKGILSANNGLNLYRGCTNGCIYCDSRSKCYQMDHEFEDIEVKENALVLLEDRIRRKRKPCMIGTGSMSDPYSVAEIELKYTRSLLELIKRYGFGVTLITKSNLILRDLDLIKDINDKTKCVVQMTLTTFDETLCKKLERKVCTTKERFEVLKQLSNLGVPTVVWLCPILPFINDTKENLIGLLNYCIEAKVYGIICFGMGLTLREGNREYFYKMLDLEFPHLKDLYIKNYGDSYNVISHNNNELMTLFFKTCKANNIVCDNDKIFEYLATFESKEKEQYLFDFSNL